MNSIRSRVIGVLVGCGLMAATPFMSGALGQTGQPDDGVWCTEHPDDAQHTCMVCNNCVLDDSDPPIYVCGDVVAQQVCHTWQTAVRTLEGPPSFYSTTCKTYPES